MGEESTSVGTVAMRSALIGAIVCLGSTIMCQTSSTHTQTTRAPSLIGFDFNSTHIGLTGNVQLPDGQPAAGASVELIAGMEPETSASVQSDGVFALPYPDIMSGPYSIRVQTHGYATATCDLPDGRILPPVVLRTAERIRGRITSTDDKPLDKIRVVLSTVFARYGPRGEYQKINYAGDPPYSIHEVKQTSADGRFEFDDLATGFYAFQAYAPGLISYTQEIKSPASSEINITMTSATGTISGRTLSFGTNDPLPGTVVSLINTRLPAHGPMIYKYQTALSDYDGNFVLSEVEPGYYSLSARKDHLMEVIDGCGADLQQKENAQVDVNLYPGHRVFGVVSDAVTSEPLSGVEVSALSINNEDTTATTDSEGRYSLDKVIAGGGNRLFLQAKKRGYAYTTTSGSGSGRKIPDVILNMSNLEVDLDLPMYPKGPKDYEGFFN